MKTEFEPNGQGAEIPGNSNLLTPETFNQSLSRIRRRRALMVPASIASILISGITAVGGANIGVAVGVNSDRFTGYAEGALVMLGFAVLSAAILLPGAQLLKTVMEDDVVARRNAIETALARGFRVTGRVFKHIRPAPAV